MLPYFLK